MKQLQTFAPAKVNLNLHILSKKDNGYHLLDSLVVFTKYGDNITISSSHKTCYHIDGSNVLNLKMDNNNLVIKAHKLLETYVGHKLICSIKLTKNLPAAAGIGGGSSDGAVTLKLLNKFFKLNISEQNLMKLGLTLGADFPVCLYGKNCFMSGVGEIITPIKLFPALYIGLINPKIPTATQDIFKALTKPYSDPLSYKENFDVQSLFLWLKNTHNDLQKPAIAQVAEIQYILSNLSQTQKMHPNAYIHSGMSGSGATCYIISPDKNIINIALEKFINIGHLTLKSML